MMTAVDLPYVAAIQDGPIVDISNSAIKFLAAYTLLGFLGGAGLGIAATFVPNEKTLLEKALEVLKNLGVTSQQLDVFYQKNSSGPRRRASKNRLGLSLAIRPSFHYRELAALFHGCQSFHGNDVDPQGRRYLLRLSHRGIHTGILLALNRTCHSSQPCLAGRPCHAGQPGRVARFGNLRLFGRGADPRHPCLLGLLHQHVDDVRCVRAPLMRLYANTALAVAVWGIVDFVARTLHIFHQTNQTRLHSILPEPSFFVYLTLPAIAIYLNAQLRKGGYGIELAIFAVCYVLADSALRLYRLAADCLFRLSAKAQFLENVRLYRIGGWRLCWRIFRERKFPAADCRHLLWHRFSQSQARQRDHLRPAVRTSM